MYLYWNVDEFHVSPVHSAKWHVSDFVNSQTEPESAQGSDVLIDSNFRDKHDHFGSRFSQFNRDTGLTEWTPLRCKSLIPIYSSSQFSRLLQVARIKLRIFFKITLQTVVDDEWQFFICTTSYIYTFHKRFECTRQATDPFSCVLCCWVGEICFNAGK